ncbi:HNH endonuclease [Streptomyces sp. NPDC007346]|uniref:HNH endonuclease n=1 Tax=Streptomyces sp. NPDC007346 TaxID=3154682 RepID=UPI003456FDEE
MYQRMNWRRTCARGLRPDVCTACVACRNGIHSSSGARNFRGVSYGSSLSVAMPPRVRRRGYVSKRIAWGDCGHERRAALVAFVATNDLALWPQGALLAGACPTKGVSVPVSKRMRFEVFRRDGFACRYCGSTAAMSPLEADHVTPTALGGADELDNLVTACESCNDGKSSLWPDERILAAIDATSVEVRPTGPYGTWVGEYPFTRDAVTPPDGTWVTYALIDATGPLFVGTTVALRQELHVHRRDGMPFSRWVALPCPDRDLAHLVEVRLRLSLHPPLNRPLHA